MTTAYRTCRVARGLVGLGLLLLPACAAIDTEPVAVVPAPARFAVPTPPLRRAAADGPVQLAGALVEATPTRATPPLPAVPAAGTVGKPLPITLPTALALTHASPLDVQLAGERLRVAAAQLDRAKVMWLPNIALGVDYFRHDGQIQDVAGNVFTTSKSSLLLGAGPNLVFSTGEALYAPLAARQIVRAREAEVQAARNDTTLQAAEAYFAVQQARGEVAGSIDALRRADELVRLTEQIVQQGLTSAAEASRARAEAARRRQGVEAAYERWQVAGADLARVLRLEPGTVVEPAEEPALTVTLVDATSSTDELIPIALTYRPELAADQALIQAALARVRQEATRPYLPALAVRGVGSQTPGLAGGYFGGGRNDFVGNFGARFSVDIQAVWELQNLGLGNRAARREREAEQRASLLQLLRTQDRVMAEVVQARVRSERAANRVVAAADGVVNAADTAEKNLKGLVPGKRGPGGELVLLVRPQEAVAAVTALDQAYRDYYAAVADHNRAQFQLYRALGHPAQCLTDTAAVPPAPPAAAVTPQAPVERPPSPPAAAPRRSAEPGTAPDASPAGRSAGGRLQQFAPVPVSVHPTPRAPRP